MRKSLILLNLSLALSLSAATPELGKDKLRELVKLPTISFQPSWNFDAEHGFIIGSNEHEVSNKLSVLRQELKHDDSDAERYLRMGELYTSVNRGANAHAYFAQAVSLYRRRVDAQPDDPQLLTGFGRALQGAEKRSEAESVLRKALQLAPKDAQCWIALGRFLDAGARHGLFEMPSPGDDNDGASGSSGDKISAAQVAQAKKSMDEAGVCFDTAITLAPAVPDGYFRRAMHHSLRNMMLNQIRLLSGEQKEEVNLLADYFSPECLADLQRASALDANNYRLIGNIILYEIYTSSARKGQVNWRDFSWSSLPDKSQRSIREKITRLEDLGENPDPQIAAGALEVLGIIQGPVLHEIGKCLGDLHRAVALDPSRDQAWELIAATIAQTGHYDDLLSLAENRIRENDSPRNRVILAKAYEKLKRWDAAEDEIQFAIKDSPDDFTLNLGLGALLLKRSQDDDPSTLSDADGWLARAQEILKKMPPNERTHQQIVELTLTRSIFFALSDEVETARLWVRAVLDQDKDNKMAQEILSAMDY
jgi:tetratricopeptide (TPR) repeat protein